MKIVRAVAIGLNISRRRAAELVDSGLICCNGELVTSYSLAIDPHKDLLTVQGKVVVFDAQIGRTVVMYNKPRGVEVTLGSSHRGLRSLFDEIGTPGLVPVGRLDVESEGLLILTDDGDLAQRLAHPRHDHSKIYRVEIEPHPSEQQLESISRRVHSLKYLQDEKALILELRTGYNRQIRRACAEAGVYVNRLQRLQIGNLRLNQLNIGAWRYLKPSELALLTQKN